MRQPAIDVLPSVASGSVIALVELAAGVGGSGRVKTVRGWRGRLLTPAHYGAS
jgi:hypothetical protein